MATSTIKIYKNCKIIPEKNFKVDDISAYLGTLAGTVTFADFQYVKQDLEISLKIDTSKISYSLESPEYLGFFNTNCYNYISIQNTDEDYPTYYFVVDRQWTANKTVRLALVMDTINTFNLGTDYNLNKKTKVVREHKDRFYNSYVSTSGDVARYYRRKIDFNSEGVDAVKYKTNDNSLFEEDFNQDWYLMFKSDHGEAQEKVDVNEIYPCKLYVIPETEVKVLKQTQNTKAISSLTTNGFYFMGTDFDDTFANQTITVGGQTFQFKRNMYLSKQNGIVFLGEVLNEKKSGGTLNTNTLATQRSGDITYSGLIKPYYKSTINLNVDYEQFAATNKTGATQQDWSATGTTLTVNGLDSVDRTDVTIQKIIKLPYCPFEIQYDTGFHPDSIVMPGYIDTELITWYGGVNKTYFVVDTKYSGTLINKLDLGTDETPYSTTLFQYINPSNVQTDALRVNTEDFESKLKHSDYYYNKFVYDSFTYPFKNEELSYKQLTYLEPDDNYDIDMVTGKTGSGNFMFRFNNRDTINKTTEDFQNILLVNRNNEIPIYNDSYINYLKNGYNYDKKQKTLSNIQSGIGIATGVLSTAGSFIGLSFGNQPEPAKRATIRHQDYETSRQLSWQRVTSGISGATGIFNSVANIYQTEQAFQQKQEQMKMSSAAVSTSDDVDLMSEYCGNRAHVMTYECSDKMKNIMSDLFYYCGYICEEQKTPTLNTRKNFNFIQADAVIDNLKNLKQDIIDDLKDRYSAGVTILHHVSGTTNYPWDFDQVTANHETWLNAW